LTPNLAAFQDSELSPTKIDDIVFHMTDWLEDLNNWSNFCANPNKLSPDEVHSLLIEFLVHVPAHLAAAAKLVTGLPVNDVFGIGATSEEKT
jgi:hypothetical protein